MGEYVRVIPEGILMSFFGHPDEIEEDPWAPTFRFGGSSGTLVGKQQDHPRWNADGNSTVGGLVMPSSAQEWIDACKRKFGDPPADCEWGILKD